MTINSGTIFAVILLKLTWCQLKMFKKLEIMTAAKQTINFTQEEKNAMQEYLRMCEKFKGAYFFIPPSSSSQRRSYEEKNSFSFESENIKISFSVSCSCRNVYVNKSFFVQGASKTCAFINRLFK